MSSHFYSVRNGDTENIPVTVEVVQVRPYRIVYKQTQDLTKEGQILDFYQFTVYEDGSFGEVIEPTESAVTMGRER